MHWFCEEINAAYFVCMQLEILFPHKMPVRKSELEHPQAFAVRFSCLPRATQALERRNEVAACLSAPDAHTAVAGDSVELRGIAGEEGATHTRTMASKANRTKDKARLPTTHSSELFACGRKRERGGK